MAYEVIMPYHLHMPSYFLETFTEYPYIKQIRLSQNRKMRQPLFITTNTKAKKIFLPTFQSIKFSTFNFYIGRR